jgi:hypothetical protein
MATDQSPPRTRLIVTLTIVTVVSLGALKPIFDSYYTDMFESEAKAKLAAPDEVRNERAEEDKRLNGGPLSIDKAMGVLAHGREGSALIEPRQSNDVAPLVGWARNVQDGGVAPTLEGAVPVVPAVVPGASDASAPNAADASAAVPVHGPAAPVVPSVPAAPKAPSEKQGDAAP